MSYTKNNWQAGDTITSEKLNHLEDGVGEAFVAPPIGETDVGKVLGVTQDAEENPVYGLVNVDQLFVVTLNMVDKTTYTSDKTNAEIYAAYTAGKVVVAKCPDQDTWLSLGIGIEENSATFCGLDLYIDATSAYIQRFTIFNDTVTHVEGEIAVSPSD